MQSIIDGFAAAFRLIITLQSGTVAHYPVIPAGFGHGPDAGHRPGPAGGRLPGYAPGASSGFGDQPAQYRYGPAARGRGVVPLPVSVPQRSLGVHGLALYSHRHDHCPVHPRLPHCGLPVPCRHCQRGPGDPAGGHYPGGHPHPGEPRRRQGGQIRHHGGGHGRAGPGHGGGGGHHHRRRQYRRVYPGNDHHHRPGDRQRQL